jgi:hypothetical protein
VQRRRERAISGLSLIGINFSCKDTRSLSSTRIQCSARLAVHWRSDSGSKGARSVPVSTEQQTPLRHISSIFNNLIHDLTLPPYSPAQHTTAEAIHWRARETSFDR